MTDTAANTKRQRAEASAGTERFRAAELDLLGVLEVAMATKPKVLKSGMPSLAFFRDSNEALSSPDEEGEGAGFPQVEFWTLLARGLGMLANVEGRLEVTDEADDFFAMPPDERCDALRQAWLDSRDVNEFAMCPDLELPSLKKGRTVDVGTDVPLADDLLNARRELVRLAADVEEEMPLKSFIRNVRRDAPNLYINHDDDGSWRQIYYRGIRERGGRIELERDGNWEIVEGAVIRHVVDVALSRLGWLGYDAESDTVAPAPGLAEAPSAFEVVVQPNFEVMVMGDRLDPAALWRLARFTMPRHEKRVRKYVLERKPFADALGRGDNAEDLVAFIESLSRSPLPQNVRYSLDDWARLSERVKIWPDALLIESEGVEDLDKSLPSGIRDAFNPSRVEGGHYICPAPDAAELRGTVPARHTVLDYNHRLPPVITPGEGAVLRAPREELHLRARQLLSLVSTGTATDRYELSADLVAESAEALGAEELLRRVREGMKRPLSAPLSLALRTWSGDFTRPYAGGAEVLLTDSIEQAHLIHELPEARRWIERMLAPGVFLLRPGGSNELRKILGALEIPTRNDARGS